LISRRSDSPCPVILGTITRRQGDHVIDTYKLCRFAAPNAGVLLPRP
jgi:hypothetical protein